MWAWWRAERVVSLTYFRLPVIFASQTRMTVLLFAFTATTNMSLPPLAGAVQTPERPALQISVAVLNAWPAKASDKIVAELSVANENVMRRRRRTERVTVLEPPKPQTTLKFR
jgi:hypothetical protein